MVELEEPSLDEALEEFNKRQTDMTESKLYYDADSRTFSVGLSVPPALRKLEAQVGIPRVYVGALVDRLIIEGFRVGDNSELEETVWSWFKTNALDAQSLFGFADALVYGRSYVTVAMPDEDDLLNPLINAEVPRIVVESPKSLFAKVNPQTRWPEWAVRLIKNDKNEEVAATLYLPDRTEYYVAGDSGWQSSGTVAHGLGIVPVVPVVNPASSVDTYGSSVLTKDVKSVTDALSRLLMNMQVTGELMAHPQRAILGSSVEEITNGGELSSLETYIASYLAIENPDAKAVQFSAAELANYTNAISQLMKLAATYTGLPPQYLSVESDNPASAEAINASETRLVRNCERLTQVFGEAWERVMQIALLVSGGQLPEEAYMLETVWRDPSTPTYQAIADAATKAYAGGTGPIPKQQVRIDMGYSPEQRKQMEEWDSQSMTSEITRLYQEVDGAAGGAGEATADKL